MFASLFSIFIWFIFKLVKIIIIKLLYLICFFVMKFKKYDLDYKDSFIECFLLFGKNRWYNLENKSLIYSNLEKKLLKPKYLFLCIDNNEVIWFIWWEIKLTDYIFYENKKTWHILYLFVNEKYVWKGISTILKNIFTEELNKENIFDFSVNVKKSNNHALNVYRKWWFNESKKYLLIKK